MGYVGLPLMLRYVDIGYQVLGFDIDKTKVDKLNKGESYIEHIPSDKIAAASNSLFEATTDFSPHRRSRSRDFVRTDSAEQIP